jgi:hypothetical protein
VERGAHALRHKEVLLRTDPGRHNLIE